MYPEPGLGHVLAPGAHAHVGSATSSPAQPLNERRRVLSGLVLAERRPKRYAQQSHECYVYCGYSGKERHECQHEDEDVRAR